MGFGVWGLGFGVWGLGFGVWGLGFGVWGLGFGVWGLGFGVWGLGFGVWALGFGVQNKQGFRMGIPTWCFQGFGLRLSEDSGCVGERNHPNPSEITSGSKHIVT